MAAVMLSLLRKDRGTEHNTHFCMPLEPVFTRRCGGGVHFIDEPTNGLDPAGMKHLRDLLKMLCAEYGITMILSSHILSEVESVADTIGIINHGNLVKEISMKEISEMNTAHIELSGADTKAAAYVLADQLDLKQFKIMDEQTIRVYDKGVSANDLSQALAKNNVGINAVGKKAESLEDYFLKLTEGEGESCLN